MTFHSIAVIVLSVGLLALGSCDWLQPPESAKSPPSQDASELPAALQPNVLAVVNGSPVTVEDYTQRVEALSQEQKPKSPEEKTQLLEDLVRVEVLVQDAVAVGLERDAKVKRVLQDLRRRVLTEAWLARTLEPITVESKEIEQYYQQFQAGFREPERIRLRQIVVRAEEEAKNILVALLQGADFAQVARERSVGPEAKTGGDIGWVIRSADKQLSQLRGETVQDLVLFDRLEQAAFALEVGGTSGMVKGPEGYHLVKVEERQSAKQKSLAEVWDQIKNGLLVVKRQQRLDERMAELRTQAKVEIHEERLAGL